MNLSQWIEIRKKTDSTFTIASMANSIGITRIYLHRIISGTEPSSKVAKKINTYTGGLVGLNDIFHSSIKNNK